MILKVLHRKINTEMQHVSKHTPRIHTIQDTDEPWQEKPPEGISSSLGRIDAPRADLL